MSYRPITHPHRVTVTVPRALWQRIEEAADVDHDRSAVIRAAILAAKPHAGLTHSADNRREPTERHALRLCSASAKLVALVASGGAFAGALRALVADGLTRDWRAQLRRAEMGDAWKEEVRG